jgi:hypothetical protein
MNYINHLSAFYAKVYTEARFTPHHISLYSGIFQLWNNARFENPIQVNRHELMKLSKIGSVNTYIRCLRELDSWSYIQYFPSRNITIGSRIRIIIFNTTIDNTAEIQLRHLNKQIKQDKTDNKNPSIKEIEDYFVNEHLPLEQALLFFNYNNAKGWMMGATPIQNWHAAAVSWVEKSKNKTKQKPAQLSREAIHKPLTIATNYHEPL